MKTAQKPHLRMRLFYFIIIMYMGKKTLFFHGKCDKIYGEIIAP